MLMPIRTGELLNDRYELREKLGQGGMAVVYRAHDVRLDSDVAVKIMTIHPGNANLKRFAREFRTISSLRHPNCIRVLDFGDSSYGPFFTMELFVAHPMTSLLGRPVPIILEALYQAASALEYVHGKGIIHRDVKPSNLLVRFERRDAEPQPAVEVKLSDFGLARFQDSPSSVSVGTSFAGTLQYCAPEQFGQNVIDHRADLYALGLVGYEILTGRHPFEEAMQSGFQNLMRAKLAGAVPPMDSAVAGLPLEIEEAVMSLLATEPADRPSSAAALKNALGRLLDKDPDPAVAAPLAPKPPQERPFVGRAQELGTGARLLHLALSPHALSRTEWVESPVSSVLFITGEPGIGKSELQREIARLAHGDGALVYEGRCFEGNLAPYQPFVEIFRQLLRERQVGSPGGSQPGGGPAPARSLSEDETVTSVGTPDYAAPPSIVAETDYGRRALDGLLADYTAEILRIAPDLRKWLPGEAFRQIDLNREVYYVLRAVASFFTELATIRGICLFLEDLQWADQGTLSLLQHLSAALFRARELSVESNAGWPRLFICCTLRHGYGESTRFVSRLLHERHAQRLDLRPFSRDEVHKLTAALLGSAADRLPESLLGPLFRCCHGHPLFLEQMIRAWQTHGQLVRADGEWRLSAAVELAANWPDSVREVLRARLEPLTPDARLVLSTGAVIGAVIDIDILREACREMSDERFLSALESLTAGTILFEVGSKPDLEFTHDLMRELAYTELSSSRRHLIHGRLGEILEERRTPAPAATPEILAHHFSAAGNREKACRYLIAAGESAIRSYAVEHAIQYLLDARQAGGETLEPGQAVCLNGLLATAFGAAGQPLRAIDIYEEMLASAGEASVHAGILAKIGELHFRVGNLDRAVEFLDRALAVLHHRRPRSDAGAVLRGLLGLLAFAVPDRLWRRRAAVGTKRDRAVLARKAYNTATYLWAQRNVFHCLYTNARQWSLARRIATPDHLSDAYSKLAILFGFLGLNRIALRASHRALEHALRDGNTEVVANAKGHIGMVHYFAARLPIAEELLRQALQVLDQRGDSWIRMLLYHNLRHLYSITGDTEREIASARVELEIGDRVDDSEGRCWGAYGMANALARSGRLSEAHAQMWRAVESMAGKTNIIVQPTLLHTYGFVHLQAGDYQAARNVLEQARTIIERHWAYVDYPIRTYPLLVESILGPEWHSHPTRLSGADLNYAWRMSRRALFWGNVFPNYLPHAWRVRGRAAFARGERENAVTCFKRSIEAAAVIGARYDLARAHLDMVKSTDGNPSEHERLGQQLLASLRAAGPAGEP